MITVKASDGALLEVTMKIRTKDFRVSAGDDVDLKKWPTLSAPVYATKRQYAGLLEQHVASLSALQEMLYALRRHAVLVIFQAMDAAGKDGAIKHVMSGVNPQGCQVFSFGHPSAEELEHDFLWRTSRDLPERGRIGIFNRSYYEEVLIVRVHPEILKAQSLPGSPEADDKVWRDRYHSIVDFEDHQYRNGLRIVKIFLHVSKEEQRKRLLERIDDPAKHWKIQAADLAERSYWAQYRKAYEACLSATSTKRAPWHIVPADDKLSARLFVSQIILDALAELDMSFPATTPERARELDLMRRQLES